MKFALIISCFLAPSCLFAQSDSLDYYFDDGGLSNTKNIIKVDVTSWLGGENGIRYERVLSKTIGVEFGIGVWKGGNIIPHPYNLDAEPPYANTITFNARTKIYYPDGYMGNAPKGMYNAIMYRYRTADFPESAFFSKAHFHDLIFQSGYQHFLIKRFVFDIHAGFGLSLRMLDYAPSATLEENIDQVLLFNLGLKIGYRI